MYKLRNCVVWRREVNERIRASTFQCFGYNEIIKMNRIVKIVYKWECMETYLVGLREKG